MNDMSCEKIIEMLPEFQAGALAEPQRLAVEAHVTTCETCRRELEALERTAVLLEKTKPIAPSRDLWPEVAAQLTPRKQTRDWWQVLVPPGRRWPIVAATALILIVVMSVLLAPLSSPPVHLAFEADAEARCLRAGMRKRA